MPDSTPCYGRCTRVTERTESRFTRWCPTSTPDRLCGRRCSTSRKTRPCDLSLKCIDTGVLAGLAFLDQAAADPSGIPLTAQDLSKREYFGAEVPEDGVLDWKRPAREVFNFLRACDFSPFSSPRGNPRTRCNQWEIIVLKAELTGRSTGEPPGGVTQRDGSGVCVACSGELILLKIVQLKEQRSNAGEVLRRGDRLG